MSGFFKKLFNRITGKQDTPTPEVVEEQAALPAPEPLPEVVVKPVVVAKPKQAKAAKPVPKKPELKKPEPKKPEPKKPELKKPEPKKAAPAPAKVATPKPIASKAKAKSDVSKKVEVKKPEAKKPTPAKKPVVGKQLRSLHLLRHHLNLLSLTFKHPNLRFCLQRQGHFSQSRNLNARVGSRG